MKRQFEENYARFQNLDDDRMLVASLGACARAKALAHFDERAVISNTIAVYDELLYDRRVARAPTARVA